MSLFDLPEVLPRASETFLQYITQNSRTTGICSHVIWRHDGTYKSLTDQIHKNLWNGDRLPY